MPSMSSSAAATVKDRGEASDVCGAVSAAVMGISWDGAATRTALATGAGGPRLLQRALEEEHVAAEVLGPVVRRDGLHQPETRRAPARISPRRGSLLGRDDRI
ncbi:hypothetical protein GCM10020260_24000 [Nesterenkonia halobia]|uniref:Uncharacterized protein n=1 Tax=Nesterenkonia halobia TaxID=37922 RepID=A0ABP6RER1_9MICC